MDFLSLTNKKVYDLSNIQAGIRIDSDNEFLRHYAGSDSIFDAAELQKLQEDLGEYLNDKILDKDEAIAIYAKVLGTTIEKVKEFFANEGKTEDDIAEIINASLDSLNEAEAHRECIEFLKNITANSSKSIGCRGNGYVSQLYDKIKEMWGEVLTPNQIYNIIFREVFTAEILEDAENGVLTKNDYIERKINMTKALYMQKIMTEYFDIEFADLKNDIPKEELEGVISRYFDQYFYNLVESGALNWDQEQNGAYDGTADSINSQVEAILSNEELEKKFFKKVSYEIKEDIAELISKQNSTEKNYDLSLLYMVPKIGFGEDELINFNQAYKLERGKEFNMSDFEEFQIAQKKLNIIMGCNNHVVEVSSQVDLLLEKYMKSTANYMQGDYVSNGSSTMQGEYIDYTKIVPDARARVPEIAQVLTQLHHGDVANTLADLSKIIEENSQLKGLKLELTADGNLDIQFDKTLYDDTKRNLALNNLLTIYKNQVSSRFEKMLGEKGVDEYVKDFNSARNKAIGCPDLQGLADQYKQDNGTIIDRTAGEVKTTGMYMMIVGGILVWIPPVSAVGAGLAGVGKWMAMGGMAAEYGAKYAEAKTSDTTTDEDLDNLNKHFIMDAAGMIIGFKAGSSGMKAFQKIIDKEVASILKTGISSGNGLKALKTVLGNKTMRANLLEALGTKMKKDLLISYIGDLALDGVLDIEDQDWLSLLESNAIGLLIGTSGDLVDVGRMGSDGFKLRKLREKKASGVKLNDAELRELELLEKKWAELNKPEMGLTKNSDEGSENGVKRKQTVSNKTKGNDLIVDVNKFIDDIEKNGNDYIPKFDETTSPMLKEYYNYVKEDIHKLSQKSKLDILKGIEDFILSVSETATREDYIKITDEIANLMPEYYRTKRPDIRPEIAENADKIYKWKAAMLGQKCGEADASGKYSVITNKFYDEKAHDKAVKEFTEFLENMTGKKVLVGNTAIFGAFVNMIDCFNNPEFYKDVDYIVLGHGTGSSLVKDKSDPNSWKFKYSGEPVWKFLADNVPEGKKALLLVCEHDNVLTYSDRRNMPEMYDNDGKYMEAVGADASGNTGAPAKICVGGIEHIMGQVYHNKNTVKTRYYNIDMNIESRIDLKNASYETYTDKYGNKIYKVVSTTKQNTRQGGYDFTYDVYKVDENGNITKELHGVNDKEIKQTFGKLNGREIHNNSDTDNSGYAYFGFPFFKHNQNKNSNNTGTDVTTGRREHNFDVNAPKTHMNYSQSPETIRIMISQVCDELKKHDNFYRDENYIIDCFLDGVETNSIIFQDANSLKNYLEHCRNMRKMVDENGKSIFTKQFYNMRSGNIELKWDDNLIKDVAILMVSDSKTHESLGNLVYMFMNGEIDEFSFRTTIHYIKKGYISPSTLDISLKSLITTDGKKNIGTYYIESLCMPNKDDVSYRKSRINLLENSNQEIKDAIMTLKSEIGDEIYDLRWECIPLDDKIAALNFIKDAKNIIYIRKTMLGPQNFQIKINGWDSKDVWLHDIPEISNTAATMLDEGMPFDDVMSWVAMSYRELDSKIVTKAQDQYKLEASGLLRCDRDGYFGDNRYLNTTSMTGFGYTDRYGINYVDKFKNVDAWNGHPLKVPNGYNIELTRISVSETEIRPDEYNANNPNHTVRMDAFGVKHYYEISGKMIHPKGIYVNNALDIVNSIQDMLMSKYHGKDLTDADMNDINESIGEIHWLLSHSMPWGRGSAGISDAYVKALYKSLGIQLAQPKQGVSFDLEAFCTELDDYKKNYKNLYEQEPKYVR